MFAARIRSVITCLHFIGLLIIFAILSPRPALASGNDAQTKTLSNLEFKERLEHPVDNEKKTDILKQLRVQIRTKNFQPDRVVVALVHDCLSSHFPQVAIEAFHVIMQTSGKGQPIEINDSIIRRFAKKHGTAILPAAQVRMRKQIEQNLDPTPSLLEDDELRKIYEEQIQSDEPLVRYEALREVAIYAGAYERERFTHWLVPLATMALRADNLKESDIGNRTQAIGAAWSRIQQYAPNYLRELEFNEPGLMQLRDQFHSAYLVDTEELSYETSLQELQNANELLARDKAQQSDVRGMAIGFLSRLPEDGLRFIPLFVEALKYQEDELDRAVLYAIRHIYRNRGHECAGADSILLSELLDRVPKYADQNRVMHVWVKVLSELLEPIVADSILSPDVASRLTPFQDDLVKIINDPAALHQMQIEAALALARVTTRNCLAKHLESLLAISRSDDSSDESRGAAIIALAKILKKFNTLSTSADCYQKMVLAKQHLQRVTSRTSDRESEALQQAKARAKRILQDDD